MNKIKKGDEIIVIAGKDKGKRGAVLAMLDDGNKVLVENVNVVKRHTRGNPQTGQASAIVPKAKPLHRSNVMLYDPTAGKGSRVGIRTLKDGSRERYFKASDQLVDVVKK